MSVKITPQHMELVKRFHDNHPEAYTAEHAAFLKGTNLSEAAQQKIVDLGAPEIAHDQNAIERVSSMPEAAHVKEIARLHEASKGDDHENSAVDKYITGRAKRGKER
ncbi:MAG: hypothetical protein ACHQLQ_01820 [Candidatus Acidiferrales bacterium]